MSSTTLIFIHGAWHGPTCWINVTSRLQQQGYQCVSPQLGFSNTEQPVQFLAGSIGQVQHIIASETALGNNVILVNHSFGGSVGCSSMKGFSEKDPFNLRAGYRKVVGIVQICAFTPPSNKSLYNMIDPDTTFHHSDPDGLGCIDNSEPTDIFYNDIPPEEAELWKDRLVKHLSTTLEG